MNDPLAVRIIERQSELSNPVLKLSKARSAKFIAANSRSKLSDQPDETFALTPVEQMDDVGVRQSAPQIDLVTKTFSSAGIKKPVRTQNLHRQSFSPAAWADLIDPAHPPLPKLSLDAVSQQFHPGMQLFPGQKLSRAALGK